MKKSFYSSVFFLTAVAAALCSVPAYGQNEITIEQIDATNLGDGRILFRVDETDVPLNGTHRLIDGFRSEYILAEFADGLYNGTWEHHRNNRLVESGAYKAGIKHGVFKEFYSDGTVKSETPITDGKVDGTVKNYYTDGTIQSEKGYKEGAEHGPERYWEFGADEPKIQRNFFEGVPDGRQYVVMSSNGGDYIEVRSFDKGKPVGDLLQTWAESGDLKQQGSYRDGEMDGVWVEIRRDGKIVSEITYARGKRNGPSKSFFTDNSVEKITMYVDDKREGIETTFRFDGGRVASEYNYVADRREGEYRTYYDDEKPTLREEGIMRRGTEVWKKEYYPNGNVRRVQERPASGGTWTTIESFDERGRPVEQ